jgi:hypothetical protein
VGSTLLAVDTELDLKETALGYGLGVSLKLRNLKGSCASQVCKSRRIESYFWREKEKLELAGGHGNNRFFGNHLTAAPTIGSHGF